MSKDSPKLIEQCRAIAKFAFSKYLVDGSKFTFVPLYRLSYGFNVVENCLIGEGILDHPLKTVECVVELGEWYFCLERLTDMGKQSFLEVPPNRGVIAGYFRNTYCAFKFIELDDDPRSDYINWIMTNVYSILNPDIELFAPYGYKDFDLISLI